MLVDNVLALTSADHLRRAAVLEATPASHFGGPDPHGIRSAAIQTQLLWAVAKSAVAASRHPQPAQ